MRATVDRDVVGLGDPFLYVVEVHGPPDMRVFAEAGPFVVAARPSRSRSNAGTVVRIEQRLICLDRGCAPGEGRRRVALPPVRVKTGQVQSLAPPAKITLAPRVPESAVMRASGA